MKYLVALCVAASVRLAARAQGPDGPAAMNLADPQSRAAEVLRLQRQSETERTAAWQRAAAEGWAPRGEIRGRVYELQAIRDGRLYVYWTENQNAAISTAANLIRNTAPYNLNGSGWTVGEWDAGSPLANHQELTGRVTIKDGAATDGHSTHVGGTLAAAGVVNTAMGMAPGVNLDSYEWNSDTAEMTSRGMAAPGESGKLQLSNHSYGYVSGWEYGTWAGPYAPYWWGTWGNRESDNFGQYDSYARDWDTVCYNAPYYLPFKSAGNDRDDAAPAAGTTFYYYTTRWRHTTYNPATHPYSDGWDNGGYDTLPLESVAKNIVTVGAVNDAVSGGVRSLANATMTTYSGWGPADDGRVKPDIVANGASLYSCYSDSTTSYATMLGTSMSSPNACGTAVLLVEYYNRLFPGQYMRASMLKGLIIHTADDLGNPGPDYQFGWGLMNGKAAADLIKRHYDYPGVGYISESFLSAGALSRTNAFAWDGVSAIRVTLCWTDPAGPAQTTLDSTNRMLVNDLDLRVVGPLGDIYPPYVLARTNPSAPATTGDNNLDNVEQVYIASPGHAGMYRATVGIHGSLSGGTQNYSVVVSGVVAPAATVDLVVTGQPWNVGSASPDYGTNTYAGGTSVTASVMSPYSYADASNTVWYACTGWVGTGSAPATGTSTNTGPMLLTANSGIAWQWVVADRALSNQTVAATTNIEARDTITAQDGYRVAPPGNVTFRAGGSVRLLGGFTAQSGSVFRATSEP